MISLWKKKNIISFLLLPISFIYFIVMKLNFFISTPKRFSKKIICIGNITAGGAGKTPTAIAIAKELKKKGKKIVFAVRNYHGSFMNVAALTAKDKYRSDIIEEAFLLSEVAPTFVAPTRIKAVEEACKSNADIVIVDDGLQNNKFFKDVKIMVIDGIQKFGNGMLIPSGPLRDTRSSIQKADLIVKINFSKEDKNKNHYAKGVMKFSKDFDSSSNYIAFAGLGYPEKFFKPLKSEVNIVQEVSFPDHYIYKENDISNLLELAKKHNARLITTRKDAIKIDSQVDISVVDYELALGDPNKMLEAVFDEIN